MAVRAVRRSWARLSRALFAGVLAAAIAPAHAIVIRHDVDEARYLASAQEFPALADLPHEGHGVLIAPRWVLTAAHAARPLPIAAVEIAGSPRAVTRVVVHPGYRVLPASLQSGDAAPTMAFLAATDDIALIELAEPVTDVEPVALYRGSEETGRRATIVGKGARGNGRDGQANDAPHRTQLRRAHNRIASADGRWLGYRFDAGADADELEGMPGSGDSGGPVLIEVDGTWQLAGLASWKYWRGDLAAFRGGIYGQTSYQVRVSHYLAWIDGVIAGDAASVDDAPVD